MKEYSKNCPKCNKLIIYRSNQALKYGIKHHTICPKCKCKNGAFVRSCPNCDNIITYNDKRSRNKSETNKIKCKECRNPQLKLERYCPKCGEIASYTTKMGLKYATKNNTLCKKCIELCRNQDRKCPQCNKNIIHHANKGSAYMANKRNSPCRQCRTINISGENHPNYGKIMPNLEMGTGIGGWYKNHYFRSLKELSYMIYLDKNNIKWETAEQKRFIIKYINSKNINRTYRPDFFLPEFNKLIEIKPKNLHFLENIQLKTEAAIEFCKVNNLFYQIIDFETNKTEILKSFNEGLVKFSETNLLRFIKNMKRKKL